MIARTSPPPTDPWDPGVRAADVPVAEGVEPGPFDDLAKEFETASDIDTRTVTVTFFRTSRAIVAHGGPDAAATGRPHRKTGCRQQDGIAVAQAGNLRRQEKRKELPAHECQRAAHHRHRGRARRGRDIVRHRDRGDARSPNSLAALHVTVIQCQRPRSAGASWCRCRRTIRPRRGKNLSRASTVCSAARSRRKVSCCRRRICSATSIIPTTASKWSTAIFSIFATIFMPARSSRMAAGLAVGLAMPARTAAATAAPQVSQR